MPLNSAANEISLGAWRFDSPHHGLRGNTGHKVERLNESIYDHPKYYDLVFGNDCAAELRFIQGVIDKHLKGQATRLFEPACGTGRLLYGLAKRGYEVEGIDLNPNAVEFSNHRFERHQLTPTAWVADMSNFRTKRKWDLAFNTINSFRHLTTENAALRHLQCMAKGTRRGGLYLIGLHISPTSADPCEEESWSARRGHLSVLTRMWTAERNPQKRFERFGMTFDVYMPTRQFRIEDELKMRSYTQSQFQSLVDKDGLWTIEETYDFGYDINDPIQVDSATEDVVYVLKKI